MLGSILRTVSEKEWFGIGFVFEETSYERSARGAEHTTGWKVSVDWGWSL